MKVIPKATILLFKLGDFAPRREEFPTPSAFSFQSICAGHAIDFRLMEILAPARFIPAARPRTALTLADPCRNDVRSDIFDARRAK